jgi:hypothetical protein
MIDPEAVAAFAEVLWEKEAAQRYRSTTWRRLSETVRSRQLASAETMLRRLSEGGLDVTRSGQRTEAG